MTKATVKKPNLDIIVEQINELNKKFNELYKKHDEIDKKLDEVCAKRNEADEQFDELREKLDKLTLSNGHYFELDKDDKKLIIKITYCRDGDAICSKTYHFDDAGSGSFYETYDLLVHLLLIIGAVDSCYEYCETDYECVYNVFNIFDDICRMSKYGWNKVCTANGFFWNI